MKRKGVFNMFSMDFKNHLYNLHENKLYNKELDEEYFKEDLLNWAIRDLDHSVNQFNRNLQLENTVNQSLIDILVGQNLEHRGKRVIVFDDRLNLNDFKELLLLFKVLSVPTDNLNEGSDEDQLWSEVIPEIGNTYVSVQRLLVEVVSKCIILNIYKRNAGGIKTEISNSLLTVRPIFNKDDNPRELLNIISEETDNVFRDIDSSWGTLELDFNNYDNKILPYLLFSRVVREELSIIMSSLEGSYETDRNIDILLSDIHHFSISLENIDIEDVLVDLINNREGCTEAKDIIEQIKYLEYKNRTILVFLLTRYLFFRYIEFTK